MPKLRRHNAGRPSAESVLIEVSARDHEGEVGFGVRPLLAGAGTPLPGRSTKGAASAVGAQPLYLWSHSPTVGEHRADVVVVAAGVVAVLRTARSRRHAGARRDGRS